MQIYNIYGPYEEIKKINGCIMNGIKIKRNTFFKNSYGSIFYGAICETNYSLDEFIFTMKSTFELLIFNVKTVRLNVNLWKGNIENTFLECVSSSAMHTKRLEELNNKLYNVNSDNVNKINLIYEEYNKLLHDKYIMSNNLKNHNIKTTEYLNIIYELHNINCKINDIESKNYVDDVNFFI
jgi:hypothetical protein